MTKPLCISTASLLQCKEIADQLTIRVIQLVGVACELEDAVVALATEIDHQRAADNPPLCSCCAGSGEGQHEGTCCRACGGKGTAT